MKKKTYITPDITETAMQGATLLCASDGFRHDLGTTEVDGSSALTKGTAPMSHFDVWDDDWSK